MPKKIFMTWFIRIIPVTFPVNIGSKPKPEHSREEGCGKSQSLITLGAANGLVVLTRQWRS
jgi:hypothetical protein